MLIRISGAVTTSTIRTIKRNLATATATSDSFPRVLLDLNAMTFIDRAGLKELLDLQRLIIDTGGEFELLNPSAAVVTMVYDIAHESTG